MIYISKFRSNDLNPSKGKQIEFNKGVVDKFFNFTDSEHIVDFECHSVLNPNLKEDIHVEFKLSPSRGDYKIYQNSDGSKDLKDFFLDTLHLESDKNLDDYFAIKKKSSTKYMLYYLPKDLIFSNFFSIAANDQILFITEKTDEVNNEESDILKSRQIIYYGAPGTGKSHKIKETLGEYEGCPEDKKVPKANIFRTTFHPDSDYSTFVGAYKPTKGSKPLYGLNGGLTVRLNDGEDLSEEIVKYEFIAQSFLNSYMQAYRKPNENVYLIIEEINRGNCAQIFGDLFQLLDRDANGKSVYSIKADADLKSFLEKELGGDNLGIKDGELCLPSNLYIYATMNTSDQSLFPIDSAFKRRWDWEYEPIKYKNADWIIDIAGVKYKWSDFQKEVNTRILKDTGSEDKMLGDYFVNPPSKVISYNLFRNKILFYLWNDVCKDGDTDIFPTDTDFSFSKLYGNDCKQIILSVMDKLGLKPISEDNLDDDGDNEIDTDSNGSYDRTRYIFNGDDNNGKGYSKGGVAFKAVEYYCSQRTDLTAKEVMDNWLSLGVIGPNLIETVDIYAERTKYSKDPKLSEKSKILILTNGEKLHVTNQFVTDRINDFINKVNNQDWGITITEMK